MISLELFSPACSRHWWQLLALPLFMAAALGYALTKTPFEALLIFTTLGFGLALPYLAVSLFPSLSRYFPKPGAWMERFRQFLAFPIYATVVWLIWVLALQSGANGAAVALSGLVIIALMVWVYELRIKNGNKLILLLILGFGLIYTLFVSRSDYTFETMGEVTVAPYSKKTLDTMLSQKTSCFCRCNGGLVPDLQSQRSAGAFLRKGARAFYQEKYCHAGCRLDQERSRSH